MQSGRAFALFILLSAALTGLSCSSENQHNYCTGPDCPEGEPVSSGGGGATVGDDDDVTGAGTPVEGPSIRTVAGTGRSGSSGDGSLATDAQLNAPLGVATGPGGTFYVADTGNQRIRRVDVQGIITTWAGNGSTGDGGDGGAATKAALNAPSGVAVDGVGNVFIADTGNNRIRMVDPSGKIATVAGTGTKGFSGDGIPATSALLNAPQGVGFDSLGNLYIADTGNSRVRKVNAQNYIVAVAGTSPGFGGDNGAATLAQLKEPTGVGFDSKGALLIVDSGNARIRRVTVSTIAGGFDTIDTIVGGGSSAPKDGANATSVSLGTPRGVASDSSGNLFISDSSYHQVFSVDAEGILTILAGDGNSGSSGDGGSAVNARLDTPWGLSVSTYGDVYIADSGNDKIRLVVH